MKPLVAFFHIEKTAGTTFKSILADSFGLSFCDTMMVKRKKFDTGELRFARRIFPALKGFGGHSVLPKPDYPGENLLAVTFLRDPVSRTISKFQHYCTWYFKSDDVDRCLDEFAVWVGREYNRDVQTAKLTADRDVVKAKGILANAFDCVGLTERFDASLRIIQSLCPYRLNLRYRRRQKSRTPAVKNALLASPRCVGMLNEATARDRAVYEYAASELFPRLLDSCEVDPSAAFDTLTSKYTPGLLLHMWYNKVIYRTVVRMRSNRAASR